MALSPPHPLYGAYLRTRRARQLIGTLRRQLQRWTDAQATGELHFKQIEATVFEVSRNDPPVEHLFRAAITIGEIAYNCRAALDYLVAELARWSNNGKEVRGTQFPIEDREDLYFARVTGINPDDPEKKIGRYLKKVPKEAVEIFRELQPFAGGEWTELLRDISNPDKHRFVPLISSNEDFRDSTYDPVTETIKGKLAVHVVFEHNRELDVVHGLTVIQRETANLIVGLAPVFKTIQI